MGDYEYINSYLYNQTESPIPCEYAVNFATPQLPSTGEYYLSIVRFNIPNTLPIFEFIENKYYVTLSYGNDDFTTPITMKSVDNTQNIYTFQQFIDMINTSLDTAFQDLKTNHPGAPPTESPYMVFNHSSDTFSLHVPQNYVNEIEIFFNYDLEIFFHDSFKLQRIGINRPDQKDFRFLIENDRNNISTLDPDFYEFQQQITTLYNWYDMQSIVFTTSTIPVRGETISTRDSAGKDIQVGIITDFVPELGVDRSNFIYNANPYRMIDLTGHLPLRKFDYRLYYVTKSGDNKPLTLPPGFSMSIKFMFKRKDAI